MSKKSVQRSITMTQEMRDRLALLVSKQPRDTTEADLIREAIRLYLDNQEDIIGSRKHFTKAFGRRVDHLERLVSAVLSVNLKTLHMLSERLQKQPVQLEDLLRDAVSEGVNSHTVLGEMIEVFVARRNTKPPAR